MKTPIVLLGMIFVNFLAIYLCGRYILLGLFLLCVILMMILVFSFGMSCVVVAVRQWMTLRSSQRVLFITVPIMIIMWFATSMRPVNAIRDIGFRHHITSCIAVKQLQMWAVNSINNHVENDPDLSQDEWPDFMHCLNPTSASMRRDSKHHASFIRIYWGASFESWGVLVGDAFFTATNQDDITVKLWEPGIYQWYLY